MNCAQCHVPMRGPTESKFCDVCDSMLASLFQSDRIATWFIDAVNEEKTLLRQWVAEKSALLGEQDERR